MMIAPAAQPQLWGHSIQFWDGWGVRLMFAGAAFGILGLAAALLSSLVLYRVAGIAQSELETKTGSLQAEVATQTAKAKEAELKIAQAQQIAAQASLEAERIKKQVGWRNVSKAQLEIFKAAIGPRKLQLIIHWGAGDAEGSAFAHRLAEMLNSLGCQIVGGNPIGQLGEERHGVQISGSEQDEVSLLTDAFKKSGYDGVKSVVVPPNSDGSKKLTDIFVGYRSPPLLGVRLDAHIAESTSK